MAKSWIANTVVEKGAEGRRWRQEDDSSHIIREVGYGDQVKAKFSTNNGALVVHMSERWYAVQALEVSSKSSDVAQFGLYLLRQVDSKRANTIWVGDGRTKIGALFTGAPAVSNGQTFRIRNFDIVSLILLLPLPIPTILT